jgi:serine/threonine protein kinase
MLHVGFNHCIVVLNNYRYMAPEVFKKEPYNQSADVYSFGVVAYEVLTRSMLVFTHVGVGRVADTPGG